MHVLAGTFNVQGTGALCPDNLVMFPQSLVEITLATLLSNIVMACLGHGHCLAKGCRRRAGRWDGTRHCVRFFGGTKSTLHGCVPQHPDWRQWRRTRLQGMEVKLICRFSNRWVGSASDTATWTSGFAL
ncbi:hypothetical protein OG21DRAFT_1505866 [Imleria badia]|nr:hypothetical protein OG21DRAFT_1505866 [Imleria badia]